MKIKKLILGAAVTAIAASAPLTAALADAHAKELYVPSLSYRTGPFAGGGIPFANGFADYLNMLNERDGGIGGVKVKVEECETGYNAQKGVECYEATKGQGRTGLQPALHRHHVAADPESTCRQDSGSVDGIRPFRRIGRRKPSHGPSPTRPATGARCRRS